MPSRVSSSWRTAARQRDLRIARLGCLQRCPPAQSRDGASRARSSRMIWAICSLLSRSASSSETPSGTCQRQESASKWRCSLPMILVRGWAGGIFEPAAAVNRSIRRSRRPSSYVSRMTVSLSTETSPRIIGISCGFQPGLRLDPGTIEQKEPFDLGRLGIVGIERSTWALRQSLVAAQRGQQTVSVPDRPAQVNELDLIVGCTAVDLLAKGLEIHCVERRAGARDVSPQRGDGAVVIGDPQAAQAPIAVGDRTGRPSPAASNSNADAAADQSPSLAHSSARSNDSRKASVAWSGAGQRR